MMLKKYACLLTLLAVLLSASVQAQYRAITPELYLGVNGGATMSTATLIPLYIDKGYIYGANGGLSLRYIAEKNFGIEADLNYFQCGWKDDYGYGSTDSYQRNLSYVELPFLMHAYLGDKSVRFFLNAGPKIAWFLSESESIASSYTSKEVPYYGKTVENYFQWGALGGLGFEVHMGKVVAGLEGRYYYGLSDIFSNAITDDFVSSSLQQISLNFFCLFRLK